VESLASRLFHVAILIHDCLTRQPFVYYTIFQDVKAIINSSLNSIVSFEASQGWVMFHVVYWVLTPYSAACIIRVKTEAAWASETL